VLQPIPESAATREARRRLREFHFAGQCGRETERHGRRDCI